MRRKDFCLRHGTPITVVGGETFSPAQVVVRDVIARVAVFSTRLHSLRSHNSE